MGQHRIPGFRLGIYIFKDAEIVDFVAHANRPVQAQATFTESVEFARRWGLSRTPQKA